MMGLASALRAARIALVKDAIDAAGTAGLITFLGGTRPATGAAITAQPVVAACPLAYPCGTLAGGTLTLSAITPGTVVSAEPISWARLTAGNGAFVADLSVGLSGADILVDTLSPPLGTLFSPLGVQSLVEGGA